MTGEEAIAWCRESYRVLTSYEGVTETVAHSEVDVAAPLSLLQSFQPRGKRWITGRADVRYLAPGRVNVSGPLGALFGYGEPGTFDIVSDGKVTWSRWTLNGNGWEAEESCFDAISRYTGVTAGACTVIPELLLGSDCARPFGSSSEVAPGVRRAKIRGTPAWRAYLENDVREILCWIDACSGLLLKLHLREDVGRLEAKLAEQGYEQSEEEDAELGPFVPRPSGVCFQDTIETYHIRSINKPIPEKWFVRPDGAPDA